MIGERVRFSVDGLLNGKRKQRHGVAVKVAARMVWVRWDGNQNCHRYLRDHIERLAR